MQKKCKFATKMKHRPPTNENQALILFISKIKLKAIENHFETKATQTNFLF
jgi:hypothetical protein